MSSKTSKLLVMLGTDFTTQGGVASVVKVYREAGLFARYPSVYLATHRDGGALRKLAAMLGAMARFGWLLLQQRVGLVHIHVASRASFWRKMAFVALARLFRVPYIMHLHGAEFAIFYEKESGARRKALIRRVFNSSAAVVVLSSAWRDWMTGIGIEVPVHAIHNPVVLPPASAWGNRQSGDVLFLGRLGQRKGSFDLVEAAARPAAARARLLLGGDGDVAGVRQRAAALGVADRVEMLGWVGAERRAALLQQAWIYCLPSYNEGLPMSLLEAMAAGLPVITSPVGGIPDAVTDGVEGFLVAPGDVDGIAARLVQMIADPDLARRMGSAARHKVERTFSSAVILPRLETLYRQLGMQPA